MFLVSGCSKMKGGSYTRYKPYDTDKIVCIYFDDGWKSQLKAIPYLDKYNYKISLAIVADYATKQYPSYMTWKEIRQLGDKGHDIQYHSLNHENLTRMSETELELDILQGKKIFESQGFILSTMVYPYGSGYDSATVREIVKANFSNARTISYLTSNNNNDLNTTDKYAISGFMLTNTTTFEEFKQLVNEAKGSVIVIITYHEFDTGREYSITSEDFAQQMAYLHDSGFKVKLLNELWHN